MEATKEKRKPKVGEKVYFGDRVALIKYVHPDNSVNLHEYSGAHFTTQNTPLSQIRFADAPDGTDDAPETEIETEPTPPVEIPERPAPKRPTIDMDKLKQELAAKAVLQAKQLSSLAPEAVIIPDNRKRRLNPEKANQIAKSFQEVGQLQPILITPDKRLIAGRHRLEAAMKLNWTTIRAEIVELDDLHAELAEIDENLIRNEGTELERSEEFKRRKEIYEALHPETKQGSAQAKGMNQAIGNNVSETISPTFAQDTAAKTEKSKRTIEQSVQIANAISEDVKAKIADHDEIADSKTELLALARLDVATQLEAAEMVVSGAAKSVKDAVKQMQHQERQERGQNLPEGVYSIVYADPAWEYRNSGTNNAAATRYDTMPTEKICQLPTEIGLQVAPEAVLFMWATNPLLLDAFAVIRAWGFEYKTNRVWVKDRNAGGFYTLGQHELLLIATKGTGWEPDKYFTSIIEGNVTEHSRKPLIHDQIEAMYPKQRYVELFARDNDPRDGWTFWGDQANG